MDPNPTFQADYYVLRLKKGKATPEDRSRTRRQLDELIANEAARPHLCESLTSVLRYEPMSGETAARVLVVLLAGCGKRAKTACLRARLRSAALCLQQLTEPRP